VCRSRGPQVFLCCGFKRFGAIGRLASLPAALFWNQKGDVLARIAALLRSNLTVKAKPFPPDGFAW
jgi:hypothetical protein